MPLRHLLLVAVSSFQVLCGPALAQVTGSPRPAQEVVYTRGELRGVFEEDGGRRHYAQVKLAPGRKIPFSTVTYRLADRKLVDGLSPGQAVEFRAERIDGENTITRMQAVKK
jgi:hypothetical protein